MDETLTIEKELKVHITSEVRGTAIDYKFEFKDIKTNQTGSISISVKDGLDNDLQSNCEIIEKISKSYVKSLEEFWKSYIDMSKINEWEKVKYLLAYAIIEFRNLQIRSKI